MRHSPPKFLCITLLLTCLLATQVLAGTSSRYIDFNIRSQSITSALVDFGLQSGAIIALGEHQSVNVRTNPVQGKMRAGQALKALLEGTGYGFEFLADHSIRVFPVPVTAVTVTPEEPIIDEVIITTQKRPQSPLEVPIATSVFTAVQLNNENISSINDIATQTPGLVATRFSYGNPTFNIRGAQNTFSSVGTSEPTGVFLDEIYISRFSASDMRLFDLHQIVVARGPQGTLFGRNVTSGAILLFTAPPNPDKKTSRISLTGGNENFKELKITSNLPMGDTTAVKISGIRTQRGGTGQDLLLQREQDNLDSRSVRLQLLTKPTPTSTVTLSLDHSWEENNGRTLTTSRQSNLGIRQSLLGVPQHFKREISGASLNVKSLLDNGELTSISGYRKASSDETFSRSDLSFTLLDEGFQEISQEIEHPETFSQEFRYTSASDKPYNFIAGIYLFFEDSNRRTTRTQLEAITGNPQPLQIIEQSATTQSYAVYFDNTFAITPTTHVTLGARYTFEQKDAEEMFSLPLKSFTENARESWQKFIPRTVFTWQPSEHAMFYTSYTLGFTAGGFNTEAATVEEFTTPFDPEKSDAFELGANTSWIGGNLTFDAVLFRQRYRDKQEFSRKDIMSPNTILNASKATADGVEIEAAWKINEKLRLSATYAYLNARYDKFDIPGEISRSGNQLPGSPRHQYSLALDINQPLQSGRVTGSFSWNWQDSYTPGSANTRFFPSFGLLDARISYKFSNQGVEITGWANNLLDEEYQLATTDFSGSNGAWYALPRLFGLTLNITFGQ